MTIEVLSPTSYAIKRAVARRYGYNPYDTHSWLSRPVVRRTLGRNEYDANRVMADAAVYRRTAGRLDYRSI